MLRIKELRKLRGFTQEKLGSLVGASKSSISFYETGKQEPNIEMLKKIADVLEVTTDALVGRDSTDSERGMPLQTDEARIISERVDRMPREDREKALNILRAAYSDYFNKQGEKMA